MNDLISIVLPVYNGEKYLAQSIESIINQTYVYWELIIIDDCSVDLTSAISKRYEKKDKRIRYYKNIENLRLPSSLNKGFSLSNGKWLTWTSDDNVYHIDALEKMLSAAKNNNAKYVIASSNIIDSDGKIVEMWETPSDAYEVMIGRCVGNACFLYSREVYLNTGEYDSNMLLCEDWDYWQRICSNYCPIVIKEILYDYRWHKESLSSTLNKTELYSNIRKMLLKNRKGFGKINLKQKKYYYSKLNECNTKLKINDLSIRLRCYFYNLLYTLYFRIPNKMSRIVK